MAILGSTDNTGCVSFSRILMLLQLLAPTKVCGDEFDQLALTPIGGIPVDTPQSIRQISVRYATTVSLRRLLLLLLLINSRHYGEHGGLKKKKKNIEI